MRVFELFVDTSRDDKTTKIRNQRKSKHSVAYLENMFGRGAAFHANAV